MRVAVHLSLWFYFCFFNYWLCLIDYGLARRMLLSIAHPLLLFLTRCFCEWYRFGHRTINRKYTRNHNYFLKFHWKFRCWYFFVGPIYIPGHVDSPVYFILVSCVLNVIFIFRGSMLATYSIGVWFISMGFFVPLVPLLLW